MATAETLGFQLFEKMKLTGKATIRSKEINGRKIRYLIVREYERTGEYNEAEMFCRLTKKAFDTLGDLDNVEIEVVDSFYTIDRYYKGEQEYLKPTLVLSEIKVCENE